MKRSLKVWAECCRQDCKKSTLDVNNSTFRLIPLGTPLPIGWIDDEGVYIHHTDKKGIAKKGRWLCGTCAINRPKGPFPRITRSSGTPLSPPAQPAAARAKRVSEANDLETWELEASSGPRLMEPGSRQSQWYTKGLAEKGLAEIACDGDGNCQFRSVAHQVYGDSNQHDLVREKVCDLIEEEHGLFMAFMVLPVKRYLKRMRNVGEHGDNITLRAAALLYGARCEVWSHNALFGASVLRTFLEDRAGKTDDKIIRVSYIGGNHYNSVALSPHVPLLIDRSPGDAEDEKIGQARLERIAGRALVDEEYLLEVKEAQDFEETLRRSLVEQEDGVDGDRSAGEVSGSDGDWSTGVVSAIDDEDNGEDGGDTGLAEGEAGIGGVVVGGEDGEEDGAAGGKGVGDVDGVNSEGHADVAGVDDDDDRYYDLHDDWANGAAAQFNMLQSGKGMGSEGESSDGDGSWSGSDDEGVGGEVNRSDDEKNGRSGHGDRPRRRNGRKLSLEGMKAGVTQNLLDLGVRIPQGKAGQSEQFASANPSLMPVVLDALKASLLALQEWADRGSDIYTAQEKLQAHGIRDLFSELADSINSGKVPMSHPVFDEIAVMTRNM